MVVGSASGEEGRGGGDGRVSGGVRPRTSGAGASDFVGRVPSCRRLSLIVPSPSPQFRVTSTSLQLVNIEP